MALEMLLAVKSFVNFTPTILNKLLIVGYHTTFVNAILGICFKATPAKCLAI